jgi:hypothetical protein
MPDDEKDTYEKLFIRGEEGAVAGVMVEALFNPKELGIDKNVPWKQQDKAEGDSPPQEFTTGSPRGMSFDLFVDGWEGGPPDFVPFDVYAEFVSKLEKFVMIDKGLKRPPMVTAVWSNKFPAFKGVVASMNVKYTMFFSDGAPARCNVTLKLTEASKAEYKGGSGKKKKKAAAPPPGTTVQQGDRMDQVAARTGGTPRDTAAANGIDDMNNPGTGSTVSSPGGGSGSGG